VLRTAAVMAAGESQITEHHLSDDFLEDVQRLRAPLAAPRAEPIGVQESALAAFVPEVPSASGTPLPAMASSEPASSPAPAGAAARTLEEAEIEMIRTAVAAAQGNISEASKRLGISRNTIYRKLRWK